MDTNVILDKVLKYDIIQCRVFEYILAKPKKTKKSKLLISMRNYVGFWLGFISYIIYLVEYINKIGIAGFWNMLFCVLPVFLLILVLETDRKIDNLPKEREKWKQTWEQLKKEN